MCQVLHVVDFLGSRRMETAPTSIEVLLHPAQSQSDEPSDLRGSLSPTSIYSTWQSQAVTHPIMNRARRSLTSVIEHKPLSERRIPYSSFFHKCQTSADLFISRLVEGRPAYRPKLITRILVQTSISYDYANLHIKVMIRVVGSFFLDCLTIFQKAQILGGFIYFRWWS